MWQVIETTDYLVKYRELEVYITDFTSIWYLYLTEERFLETLKEANPILEMADSEFLQKGKEMLLVPKNYHNLNITKQDTKLVLALVKRLPFKLKLELELSLGSKEMFFKQVTQVLLQTVNDLKSSQLELRMLLNKKDKEIDEYKSKGVEISARHLKTNKFDEGDHLSRHTTCEENFGSNGLPEFLLKKSVDLRSEELIVKKEKMPKTFPLLQTSKVKQEPQSQSSEILTETTSQSAGMITDLPSHVKEVKTESQPKTSDIKTELLSQNGEVTDLNNVKQEDINIEHRLISPRKKMKRLNL